MTCGLRDEELFILNLLYSRRCIRINRGFHSDKLAKLFNRKFKIGLKKPIQRLKNEGYIGTVGKSPVKYYIANISQASFALDQHGYTVIKGRERVL